MIISFTSPYIKKFIKKDKVPRVGFAPCQGFQEYGFYLCIAVKLNTIKYSHPYRVPKYPVYIGVVS